MSLQIRAVGVIGAGTMGNGIAQVLAAAGYPVTMRDLKPEYLDRGMVTITKSFDRLVSHQKLMPEQRDAALSRIQPTTELKELGRSRRFARQEGAGVQGQLRICRQPGADPDDQTRLSTAGVSGRS